MKYYFAPLEGVAGYIFRNAYVHHYGGADAYFTPFLSNPVLSSKERNDVLPENNAAAPLIPQILSNNAAYFLAIAATLKEFGYDKVNLNLGCPSGTVVSKKRGAGFLSVPEKLDGFLYEIYSHCELSVSLKTRIGMESLEEWDGLIKIFAKYPFDELIIHPRLRCELYGGKVHRESFKKALDFFCEECGISTDRLVFNGDICSREDFFDLKEEFPEISKVMIGRGALKNPEIFKLLKHEKASVTPLRNDGSRLSEFIAFHDELFNAYTGIMFGEKPVLFKMKELWSWFTDYAGLDLRELKKIRKAGSLTDYSLAVKSVLQAKL